MQNETEMYVPENWTPPKNKMLNPCVDAVFKAIFTSNNEKSKNALTSFLSAVLDKKVSDVIVEPNELPVETFGQKQSRFDIVCMVDGNEPANIEIQTCDSESFFRKKVAQIASLQSVLDEFLISKNSHTDLQTSDATSMSLISLLCRKRQFMA